MLKTSRVFTLALATLVVVVGCDRKGKKSGTPLSNSPPPDASRNAQLIKMGIATRDMRGNVVELDLRGVENISDDSLRDVGTMQYLQVLYLSGQYITPQSLHYFGGHLRKVVLEGTSIPADHHLVEELKKSRPPGFVLEFRGSAAHRPDGSDSGDASVDE